MYLKEIGKVKLLDAALEVELAERILAGTEAEARAGRRRVSTTRAAAPSSGPTSASYAGATRPRRP